MKIAIIHHQYQNKGGMERYLLDLVSGFSQLDYQLDLFVYKQDNSLAIPPGVTVHRKNLRWLPRAWAKYYFSYYLQHHFQSKDYALSLSMMRSAIQDVTVSGGTHPGCLEQMNKRPGWMDKKEIKAEKKSFESAKWVMAHSNLIKAEIEKYYGINSEKVIRLFPPINTSVFNRAAREGRQKTREKYQMKRGQMTLLFPSTGHKRKGLPELLKAMQLLSGQNVELLVAGSAIDVSSYSNVRTLGFIDDMASLYAAVDVTILPSHYEPFGLVIPESLACGTPVIISKNVGAKDVVSQDEGILCDAVTPEAIAAAINTASHTAFDIAPDFVEQHGLTLEQHIAAIRARI